MLLIRLIWKEFSKVNVYFYIEKNHEKNKKYK